MKLISQLNLWFKGPPELKEYWLNGQWMVPFEPLLGYTSSSDPKALEQEMQWLHRYTGRDGGNFIYSLEWVKPEAFEGLIDANLKNVFLPAVSRTRALWNLFYDPVLAARQRGATQEIPIDFALPAVRDLFLSDLDYFRPYFEHPHYWRIGDRPVLYVWAVPDGIRNAEALFHEARSRGIYLLGDTFGRPGPLPPLDGETGFVATTPEIVADGRFRELPELFPYFERYYQGRGGLDVIPALSCQYDDTEFKTALGLPQETLRYLARDREQVESFLRLARDAAQPIDGERFVFAGTINNWAEGTTLLPSPLREPAFWDRRGGAERIGFYHFAHLEAIHQVLFPEVEAYDGPRMLVDRRGRVRFRDCDRLGKLVLRGPGRRGLANPPDWESGANLEEKRDFERRWEPRWRRGEEPRRLRLKLRNLDGRTERVVLSPDRSSGGRGED